MTSESEISRLAADIRLHTTMIENNPDLAAAQLHWAQQLTALTIALAASLAVKSRRAAEDVRRGGTAAVLAAQAAVTARIRLVLLALALAGL